MTFARRRRSLLFALAAIVTLVAAVGPWLDRLADASFAWHMVQHLALLFVVPFCALEAHPFAWLGSPRAPWQRAAIRAARSAPTRMLCMPAVTLLLWIAVLWGVHFTPLYEAALEHPLVHVAEHALLLAAGTLFWIPVVAPPPLPAPSHAVRTLYLFIALPQGALLAVALLAAPRPLYAHYAGPGALADQHAAAAVMWMGGGALLLAAFLGVLARWAVRERSAPAAVPCSR